MLNIPLWRKVLVWLIVAAGLLLALPNLFYSRVEMSNDAEAVIASGESNDELMAAAGQWPSWLPDGLVNLGLDLRGGAHLVARVEVADVYESRMDSLWPEVRDALAAERDTIGFVTREESAPDQLVVRISEADGASRALEVVRGLARPVASISGAGQMDIAVSADGPVLTIGLTEAERVAMDDRTVRQSLEIVRRRIDEVGTREPSIQRQGDQRILIQVPGVGSAQELKDIIGTTAQLTFSAVVGTASSADENPGAGNEIVPFRDEPGRFLVIETAPVVSGEDLVDAQPTFDQNNRPAVSFRFDPTGARRFGDYTSEHVGEPFAIILDDEVISAPNINEPIRGGSGIITGNFTVESSTDLAVLLRAGALPAELTFLEERTIGPELGQDSIDAGTIACIVAFAGVMIFMVLSYGLFGLFADIALLVNVGLIFGLLSMIGATLTLPGIAGIVLTIGMAVDANVLVFERIREELKTARGPSRAISLGYEKALSAIIDANITTFITAVILFAIGSGPVRGFAITLGLGILTSVFTAIFVTRILIVTWFDRRRPKTIEV
ncbi:protein translocase subunit SecD [Pelagovum pacificum]|uniref:Protein translocase subunit SecD n=1 Tax=Pelagovum pacificum TaxID=2588711 RepID=A0A5C5GEQ9_9RHOB|nr:protein translocase subunit SecD [Pelagovum pacificum]QQA44444.1 protein translocase subunit SecD [Pelagovum pacificum]TNY32439.1 protein translocase subunit SecD [Pelagovum pacificum]